MCVCVCVKTSNGSLSFLIIPQSLSFLSLFFLHLVSCCCVQLKDDGDCEQFSSYYRASLGPAKSGKTEFPRQNSFCVVFAHRFNRSYNTTKHRFRQYKSGAVVLCILSSKLQHLKKKSQDKTDGTSERYRMLLIKGIEEGKANLTELCINDSSTSTRE